MGTRGKIIHRLTPVLSCWALVWVLSGCDQNVKKVNEPNPVDTGSHKSVGPATEPGEHVGIKKYTRIFCEPSRALAPKGASYLFTLRSDETSAATKISILNDAGLPLERIESFSLLQSDGESGLALASERNLHGIKIYSAQIDFLKKNANAVLIAQSNPIPTELEYTLEKLGHKTSYFSVSREYSYALIPDTSSFTLRDIRSFRILTRLDLSPQKYFNPILSEDGQFAFFTFRAGHNVQQVQVSLISGERVFFPLHPKGMAQFSPHWLNGEQSVIWFEDQLKSVAIYAATQAELRAGKSRLIKTLPSNPVSSMMAFIKNDSLKILWADEHFSVDASGLKYLNAGALVVMSYKISDDPTKTVEIQSFPYPKDVMATELAANSERMLQNLTRAPWSDEIYASYKNQRALVSFDLTKRKWYFHASQMPDFSCEKPIVGPEYVLESSP